MTKEEQAAVLKLQKNLSQIGSQMAVLARQMKQIQNECHSLRVELDHVKNKRN